MPRPPRHIQDEREAQAVALVTRRAQARSATTAAALVPHLGISERGATALLSRLAEAGRILRHDLPRRAVYPSAALVAYTPLGYAAAAEDDPAHGVACAPVPEAGSLEDVVSAWASGGVLLVEVTRQQLAHLGIPCAVEGTHPYETLRLGDGSLLEDLDDTLRLRRPDGWETTRVGLIVAHLRGLLPMAPNQGGL